MSGRGGKKKTTPRIDVAILREVKKKSKSFSSKNICRNKSIVWN